MPRNTIQHYLNKKIEFRIPNQSILCSIYIYLYGLYSYRTFNPIWENLDGKIFFWLSEITMLISVAVAALVLSKSRRKSEESFNLKLKMEDFLIWLFFIFLNLLLYMNYLHVGLYGDEVSYAKYTVMPFEAPLIWINNLLGRDISASSMIQVSFILIGTIASLIIYLIRTLKHRFEFSPTWTLVFLLSIVICLRVYNRVKVGFDNENTEPFLILYQTGIMLFGFSDIAFRITSLICHCIFFTYVTKNLLKYTSCSYLEAICGVSFFMILPSVASLGFTVYHGNAAFYFNLMGLIWIMFFEKAKLTQLQVIVFSVVAILTSLSTFPIVGALLARNYRSNLSRIQIIDSMKVNLHYLILLLPFVVGHFFRIIKLRHVSQSITETEVGLGRNFGEKLLLNFDSVFTNYTIPSLVLSLCGILFCLFFGNRLVVFMLLLFISLSQLVFSIFTVEASMGVTRYSNQWFLPFAFFAILYSLRFTRSLKIWPKSVSIVLICCAGVSLVSKDVYDFRKMISNYSDYFVAKKQYTGIRDETPKNLTWNLNSNAYAGKVSQLPSCLWIGTPSWRGVPTLLSGASWKEYLDNVAMYDQEQLTTLQFFEYINEETNVGQPPQLNTKCVFLTFHPHRTLVEQSLKILGFSLRSRDVSRNGILVDLYSKN